MKPIWFHWIFTGIFKDDIPHYMMGIIGYDKETKNVGYLFCDLFSPENVFTKIIF